MHFSHVKRVTFATIKWTNRINIYNVSRNTILPQANIPICSQQRNHYSAVGYWNLLQAPFEACLFIYTSKQAKKQCPLKENCLIFDILMDLTAHVVFGV